MEAHPSEPRRRFQSPRTWRYWLGLVITLLLLARGVYFNSQQAEVAPKNLPEGEYVVERVVDGDTLKMADGSRVRMMGINTPETHRENYPVEPWGPEAEQFTRDFIQRAHFRVKLQFDDERLDQYGRQLAYVWAGDQLLNEELIRAGLAEFKPHFRYSAAMKRRYGLAEREAKANRRGIWSNRPPATIKPSKPSR